MAVIYDMNEGMSIIEGRPDKTVDEQLPNPETVPQPMPALQEITPTETTSPAATAGIIATEILKKD